MREHRPYQLGLLGGGQLARMMALECHRLGIRAAVLSSAKDDPAQQVTASGFVGSLSSPHDLQAFLSQVDAATFESEFLDAKLIEKAAAATGAQIHPNPSAIFRLSDRAEQKLLLDDFKIPTAPWCLATSEEAVNKLCLTDQRRRSGIVLKQRKFGYDGYGTVVAKTFKENPAAWAQVLRRTPECAEKNWIAERYISFRRELATVFVRDQQGHVLTLPLVESLQKESRCFWVKGPVSDQPSLRAWEKLRPRFHRLLRDLDYVGVLAAELFQAEDGELIVNELAPRVHNSAHYSLDALTQSQFALHVMAVTGATLRKPPALRAPGFAMVNLIGHSLPPITAAGDPSGSLHWYGKSEARAGRKMGHVNTVARSSNEALRMALAYERKLRNQKTLGGS